MRQHGIDRQGRQRVAGIGQLLDQADAVDDDLRFHPRHDGQQGILIEHIDTAEQPGVRGGGKMPQTRRTAHAAPGFMAGIG